MGTKVTSCTGCMYLNLFVMSIPSLTQRYIPYRVYAFKKICVKRRHNDACYIPYRVYVFKKESY